MYHRCGILDMAIYGIGMARRASQHIAWVWQDRHDGTLHECGKIGIALHGLCVARYV